MVKNKTKKLELGQFFTTYNIFENEIFLKWFKSKNIHTPLLEPFAGSNNIPLFLKEYDWRCFDIELFDNKCPQFIIEQQDTISNFPGGFDMCITNPPYLGKVSASKKKLEYRGEGYADLYEKCLEVILKNCKYAAVIIPETFIKSKVFKERLEIVISINRKCFTDTECPCCLALFGKDVTESFEIYNCDGYIGNSIELTNNINTLLSSDFKGNIKINCKEGNLGCICIDGNTTSKIRFCRPDEITIDIKESSRSQTVVFVDTAVDDTFIEKCNNILLKYREISKDVFMASFKNLRRDNVYRRRLDFETLKRIVNKVLADDKRTV